MSLLFQQTVKSRSAPWVCAACARYVASRSLRFSSTEAAPPPLLSKIRGDLKTAMKAKDTTRLNVLRAVISDANNAAKGPSPIKTDLQLLALLRKRKSASEAAASEAQAAKRVDLQEKQEAEISVLDEYAGQVEIMSEDEVERILTTFIDGLKNAAEGAEIKAGNVLKEIFKPEGVFGNKPVDKRQVTQMVNNLLKGK